MNWIDILVIVLVVLVLGLFITYMIVKKVKGEAVTGCDCSSKKGKIVKAYYKEKAKEEKKDKDDDCPYCHK
jgi:beta-lactam-binding protein with PASTA domain